MAKPSRWRAYAVIIVATAMVALMLRIPVVRAGLGTPVLLFVLAVVVSAWYGGLESGLLSTGLILALTFPHQFTPERAIRFFLFLACGLMVSGLLEGLHAARRKVEKSAGEIARGQERLRRLLESITDYAIFTTDGKDRVTSWSPGATRLLGHDESDVLGAPVSTFIPEANDLSGLLRPDDSQRKGLAPARSVERSVWCLRRDGTRFCGGVSLSPLHHETDGGATWVVRDETEQNRVEAELRTAKEIAESANRTKDHFLATLSHELRTPLTPALISASAYLNDPATPAPVRASLEVIHRNIMLEARLIDDLLDVTSLGRGKLRLRSELVDAHYLIGQALRICREEIAAAGLNIELELRAEAHYVEVDPARFQQILWNLLRNAVKFTPSGGRIAIRTANARVAKPAGVGPSLRLLVEVSDTGQGIEPDFLPRLFEPFEQAGNPSTSSSGGLGLGLSIGRSLAEALGGHLTAASAGKDQGAAFTLDLPALAPPPEPAEEDLIPNDPELALMTPGGSTPSIGDETAHILLVEDNEDTLRLMSRLLRRKGYRVSTASCLAAAIEAAAQPFDLLVSDIGLPDGTGLDLMRHLKGLRPVPAIALSGFGMDEDLRKSREAGFMMHLTKPIDFPELEAAIRQSISGR